MTILSIESVSNWYSLHLYNQAGVTYSTPSSEDSVPSYKICNFGEVVFSMAARGFQYLGISDEYSINSEVG